MFENLGFLKSKFSYLTIDKYRKDECLKIYRRISKIQMFENLSFLLSKLLHFTIGENQKIGFLKVGEKVSIISEHPYFRPDSTILTVRENWKLEQEMAH